MLEEAIKNSRERERRTLLRAMNKDKPKSSRNTPTDTRDNKVGHLFPNATLEDYARLHGVKKDHGDDEACDSKFDDDSEDEVCDDKDVNSENVDCGDHDDDDDDDEEVDDDGGDNNEVAPEPKESKN
ncbi:hypothetical protein PIB30_052919 [Stylosanthes scabra]|uniref:Uncharacterized protein n=1 Tax=Stylosanthes scabra TaxID=79078 RepID=A0ABU6VKP9_9FABA|nr:hypothetical protein [Stylosanthes scabra]